MIKTTVLAGETYRSTTRPAIFSSIHRLLDLYGLNDSQIYFNGDAADSKLFGSRNTDRIGADRVTDLKNRDKLYVIAEVEYSEFNTMFGNSQHMKTQTSVWADKDTGTIMTPQYEGRKVNVDVNKHFRTRQEAVNFVNRLNTATTQQVAQFTFDATIHYPINYSIINLLKEIYDRLVNAKQIDPNVTNFGLWFKNNALVPFTVVMNEIGNNKLPVIPRRIEETILQMNSPTVELAKKGEWLGRYEVSFSYSFYWQEFIGWDLVYPLLVYQQEIPTKFIPMPVEEHTRNAAQNRFLESQWINEIRFPTNKGMHNPYYPKIPLYDPYVPPYVPYLVPKLQVTLTVGCCDKQILFNLKEIPDFIWNPRYLDYILNHRDKVLYLNKNPLHIKVYSGKIPIDKTQLSLDEEGNLWLHRQPNLSTQHVFVLYVNYSTREWDDDCVDDIIDIPGESHWLLPIIIPWWPWPPYIPGLPWIDWPYWDGQFVPGVDPGRGWPKDYPYQPYQLQMGLIAKRRGTE